MSSFDAVAGITAPGAGLDSIYFGQMNGDSMTAGAGWNAPDYSGSTSWPLLLKWSELLQDSSTAGKIIDLMWTDLMANTLVGTKSALPQSTTRSIGRSAAQYAPTVAYDWRYPAITLIFAVLYIVLLVWSLVSYAAKSCDVSMLRCFPKQSSAGRSVTVERYRGEEKADILKTKAWARVRGNEIVFVSKDDVKRSHISTEACMAEEHPEAQEAHDGREVHEAQEAYEAQEANRMV